MGYEFDSSDIRAMREDGSLGDFIRATAGLRSSGRSAEEQLSCPHCKARPRQRCTNSTGTALPKSHQSRMELLKPLPPEPIHPVGHWPDVRQAGGNA